MGEIAFIAGQDDFLFRPSLFAPEDTPDTVSFYDTEPLKRTLEELVNFDLINRQQVRISLGAVIGRYHYALDVLAGAATAVIGFAACYSYL